ncbi:YnbE family lipoprotein [Testudinibacter sp. P27/CKL/0425]
MPRTLTALLLSLPMLGCVPKIQLETPKEGITINMNVEVEHKIQIETDDNTRRVLGEP